MSWLKKEAENHKYGNHMACCPSCHVDTKKSPFTGTLFICASCKTNWTIAEHLVNDQWEQFVKVGDTFNVDLSNVTLEDGSELSLKFREVPELDEGVTLSKEQKQPKEHADKKSKK